MARAILIRANTSADSIIAQSLVSGEFFNSLGETRSLFGPDE
jgi:hypothetical protein